MCKKVFVTFVVMKKLNIVSLALFFILISLQSACHINLHLYINDKVALCILFYYIALPIINLLNKTGLLWFLLSLIPVGVCIYIFSLVLTTVGNV